MAAAQLSSATGEPMLRSLRLICSVALLGAALSASAATPEKPAAKSDDPRVVIASKLPGAKPEQVRPTPLPGIYEVTLGRLTLHVTADGKYAIAGDLYDLSSEANLSEKNRTTVRVRSLAKLKDSDTIVFGNAGAKHTVTVFTDTDCGYCRKLHSEMAELNRLGIRVRYAAYPRGGPGSEAWNAMEAVWCAKDRRNALTRAKAGEHMAKANCGATPVASQYHLGEEMGVDGTPAIFTESGEKIGGYMPAAKLLEQLNELRAEAAASAAEKTSATTP
jgi:thiol:disulfide interchange protein DsbC